MRAETIGTAVIPSCWPGGGFKGGYIHGASDRYGSVPERDPVTPGDVISTIYSQMGIDPAQMIYDNLQRPHPIVSDGRVLGELLA